MDALFRKSDRLLANIRTEVDAARTSHKLQEQKTPTSLLTIGICLMAQNCHFGCLDSYIEAKSVNKRSKRYRPRSNSIEIIVSMSKLKKCLYLINLLERRGAMSLKEINECFRYLDLQC